MARHALKHGDILTGLPEGWLVRAIRKGTVLLPTRDGFITASFPGADELEAAMKAETTLSTFERA